MPVVVRCAALPTTPRRNVGAWLLVMAAAWCVIAALSLFGVWIGNLWLFGRAAYGFAWLVAIGVSIFGLVTVWARRGPAWALPTLVVTVLVAAAIGTTNWESAFAHGYFRANRADFAAVSALADSGALQSRDYYGKLLPPELQHLSIDGRAAWIGTVDDDGGGLMVFLSQWAGIPDGAVGYAYSRRPPGDAYFDCFGDRCQADSSLGSGWYWMTAT